MPRSWYEVKAQGDVAEVRLYGAIGDYDISAEQFVGDLAAIKSPTIDLFIDSPGGNAYQGIAIYNAIMRHPSPIRATVDGIAASAASVVLQGARAGRKMGTGATVMVHEPINGAIGAEADHLKEAEALGKLGNSMADIYAKHAGGSVDQWRQAMKAETWYQANDAVKAGLADGLVQMAPRASLYDFSRFGYKNVPEWIRQMPTGEGKVISSARLSRLRAIVGDLQSFMEDMAGDAAARLPRAADLTVCMAPECDMVASLQLPLCKDHVEMIMGSAPMAKAIASHKTGTSDANFDGPAQVTNLSTDAGAATYRKAFAWSDPNADPDTKADYRFIHHFVSAAGDVGDASTAGCSAGIAVLNGGRGATTIPEGDKQGVWDHLASHLRDAGRTPPPLSFKQALAGHEDWPYLDHHATDGAIDALKLVTALTRARNTQIPVEHREERIRHLEAHAR